MCSFPVTSIIAIIFGAKALSYVEQANFIAAGMGVSAGGKVVAAKVLGMVGKIVGIVMTCVWAIYFVALIALFS